ncbi:uncharacterized protein [Centruroides vittatus]|uniref:uncharacterized protein n=1 Tax=Centruroides vittatus TaxID=120091 RepID=UPI003510009D
MIVMETIEKYFKRWNLQKFCIIVGYTSATFSGLISLACVIRVIYGVPVIIQNDELEGNLTFNSLLFIFPSLYCLLHLVTSNLLVTAARQENGMFMVPWIVTGFVDILLDIVAVIVLTIGAIKLEAYRNWLIGLACLSYVLLPVLIYIQMCVISHFETLFRKNGTTPLQISMENLKF